MEDHQQTHSLVTATRDCIARLREVTAGNHACAEQGRQAIYDSALAIDDADRVMRAVWRLGD